MQQLLASAVFLTLAPNVQSVNARNFLISKTSSFQKVWLPVSELVLLPLIASLNMDVILHHDCDTRGEFKSHH